MSESRIGLISLFVLAWTIASIFLGAAYGVIYTSFQAKHGFDALATFYSCVFGGVIIGFFLSLIVSMRLRYDFLKVGIQIASAGIGLGIVSLLLRYFSKILGG